MRAFVVGALLAVSACDCSPIGLGPKRFACTADRDCLPGWTCVDQGAGRECARPGSSGGGTAGGTAGGSEGGGGGGDEEGGGDAGGGDAGGTSGGGDAGGDAAGGLAGGTGGGSGGGRGGGTGGGAGGTGGGTAVATTLRFATPERTITVAVCSPAITVETVNDTGVFVQTNGTVSLTGSASIRFFPNSTCSGTPVSSVPITDASPYATFHALASAPGNFQLMASSMPALTPATQPLLVEDGPDTVVFTNAPPSPLKGAHCFPLTIGGERGGMSVAPVSPVQVTLAATMGIAHFYSDATCDTEIMSTTLASTMTTFFVRTMVDPTQIRASVPNWAPAQLDLAPSNIVRRGNCSFSAPATLPDGGPIPHLTQSCPLTGPPADTSNSAVVVQTTSSGTYADAMIRCRLVSAGTSLLCTRASGTRGAAVHWQVIEEPSRFNLAVYEGRCLDGGFPLTAMVDPSRSFLLRNYSLGGGTYDDEDTAVLTLTDGGTVSNTVPNTCGNAFIQAVEWDGVRVTRGALDGGLASQGDGGIVLGRVAGLPSAAQRAVLVQAGTDVNNPMLRSCSLGVRATSTATDVSFRRAFGTPSCPVDRLPFVAFERIDFNGRAVAAEYTATLDGGVTSATVSISAVDPTRAFVFSSAQSGNGQGGGENNEVAGSVPQESFFILELTTPTSVAVRRSRGTSQAAVTFYVVQVE